MEHLQCTRGGKQGIEREAYQTSGHGIEGEFDTLHYDTTAVNYDDVEGVR